MREFVTSYLLQSAWGGLAALAVWGIAALLRRVHTPSRWLAWLWLVVAARFVLPGGIALRLPRSQSPLLAEFSGETLPPFAMPAAPSAAAPAAAPTVSVPNLCQLAFLVWAAGVVFLAVRAGLCFYKLRRAVATACREPDGCYTGACVPAPMTLGILHPTVYLPSHLSNPVRSTVVAHEKTHIRRRDTLTKPLFYAVACLHWFNPLVWLALAQFERDLEAACDEATVAPRTSQGRIAYCETILLFAEQKHHAPGCLSFGQGPAKTRIAHLLHYRRPRAAVLALCAAIVALCCTACMVKPVATEAATPTTVAAAPSPTPASTQAPTPTPAPEPVSDDASTTAAVAPLPTAEPMTALPATLAEMEGYFSCPVPQLSYVSLLMSTAHRGDDLVADEGADVCAPADGYVQAAGGHDSYGNYIVLYHGDLADGSPCQTLYAHLLDTAVVAGQTVARGDLIGHVGNSGNSTGPHLHLEVKVGDSLLPPSYFVDYPQVENAPALHAITPDHLANYAVPQPTLAPGEESLYRA